MLNKLIAMKKPKSHAAEAFRTLRTNIQFSIINKEVKTIVVTSSQPNEGKSTVVSNLAIAFAENNKKVLLVDCDLRKPTIHKNFALSNMEGLTSLVAEEKKFKECIKDSEVNNLHILCSGPIPPNPAEILGSEKLKALLKELSGMFDVILFDAPPILAVTDAQILSTLSDGVVFVASFGEVDKRAIVRAKELIDKVGGRVLGVVMNKVPSKAKNYYKYYYR